MTFCAGTRSYMRRRWSTHAPARTGEKPSSPRASQDARSSSESPGFEHPPGHPGHAANPFSDAAAAQHARFVSNDASIVPRSRPSDPHVSAMCRSTSNATSKPAREYETRGIVFVFPTPRLPTSATASASSKSVAHLATSCRCGSSVSAKTDAAWSMGFARIATTRASSPPIVSHMRRGAQPVYSRSRVFWNRGTLRNGLPSSPHRWKCASKYAFCASSGAG